MKAIPVDINWHSGLSIYASEAFLKTVSDTYGWIGGIDDTGKMVCVLPYSIVSKSVFRLVRFPVQTMPLDGRLDVEEERRFLNSVVEYFRSTGADLIIPATFNTLFRTYPDGAIVAPYGSHVLNLCQGEDALWNNLHPKHRNVIRNAMKKGVEVKNGLEHLETAYRLVKESFRRSSKGVVSRIRLEMRMDYNTFRQQLIGFGENVKVFLAEYEGVVQGCAVIPFSEYSAYYMHGGSIQTPLTGAMNLLQWEAIRLFNSLGVHRYDFFGARVNPEKGSKAEGIIKFKERFGGEFVNGYMWKYPFRPVKYLLYSMAARARNGGDVVDQEHQKVRRLSGSIDQDSK